ncbi:hypothetical protein O181_007860 [Austropuccinia psidii MF-1]|uniref:Uncharacterized protein n=1 Tax=Austropuccinia psidii MF-1 TaxID=1389203 RepID=A0A9Q3GIC4_9BASI|nr:hypothetical protein [Austropuccinia psidii MF-1]
MNTHESNHKFLTQLPRELENSVKCKFNKDCTLDDIANTFQDVRKRKKIWKYSLYKIKGFREKRTQRVDNKPREQAEVSKKKESCHDCCSTDHYADSFPKKKKISAIKEVPVEKFKQKNLTLTLWVIPSGKNLMMTKTQ